MIFWKFGGDMSLIIILLCLLLQRYFNLNCQSYQSSWVLPYTRFLHSKFSTVNEKNDLVGTLLLVVPILFVLAIIFALISLVVGPVGYYLMLFFVLWFCLDGRDLHQHPYQEISVEQYFQQCFHVQFSIIFWFAILGWFGTVLYFVVMTLIRVLSQSSGENKQLSLLVQLQALLDWVPVRLLGLTFALVGSFSTVIKSWVASLTTRLDKIDALITEWGEIAIEKPQIELVKQEMSAVISLLDRALLVWLVVIALVSIGMWLG